MKTFVNILCAFVPVSVWRKKIRNTLLFKQKMRMRGLDISHINGIKVVSTHGINLRCTVLQSSDYHTIKEVLEDQEYHFAAGDEAIVIDIGMNIGIASLYFASRSDVKAVYGFEPFTPTYERAVLNFEVNPSLKDKIHTFNCGLGRSDSNLVLDYYPSISTRMSTVKLTNDFGVNKKPYACKQTVKIRNAAEAILGIINNNNNNTKMIVLKCDCEGAEKDIFATLKQHKALSLIDVILLEYHFSYDDKLLDLLQSEKFICFRSITKHSPSADVGIIRAVRAK